MTRSCVVRVRATEAGHVARRDAERVRNETSGIGPGSSGRRDGVGTGRGMSHSRTLHHALVSERFGIDEGNSRSYSGFRPVSRTRLWQGWFGFRHYRVFWQPDYWPLDQRLLVQHICMKHYVVVDPVNRRVVLVQPMVSEH